MKTKLYLCLLVSVCLFSACKKDKQIPLKDHPTPAATIQDSVSFTINGKNYYVNTVVGGGDGITDTNRVVDSVVNYHYYVSKSADTSLFFNNVDLSNTTTASAGTYVQLSFFKKYNTKDFIKGSFINYPSADNQAKMYAPGSYTFATDYMRGSGTNGVGINVRGIGQTYSEKLLEEPTTVTQNLQNNSNFEVTSFTRIKDNEYLLTGRFSATLFDSNEHPVNLTNGYIRLVIDYAYGM